MGESVALPVGRLSLGVTGHRATNRAFAKNEAAIGRAVAGILELADAVSASLGQPVGPPRLHSLLAVGADALALEQARERRWEVVAPLPFGRELNLAINAHPGTLEDALALLEGRIPADPSVAERAAGIRQMSDDVRLFELADEDELVAEHFLASLRNPADAQARATYAVLVSERSAVAGRVMIEQSDVVIAVWDGVSPGSIGGTRHTMGIALDEGVPVLWIDVRDPSRIIILRDHAALDHRHDAASTEDIAALMREVLDPAESDQIDRAIRFHTEQWHARSRRRFHVYRRIEALFGGGSRSRFSSLVQRYEAPAEIAAGSGAELLARADAIPGGDRAFVATLETLVLARFAWADGLSTYLSDAYRGGMVWNFLLSAFAIVVGVAYLPFASVEWKWPFAAAELILLLLIVAITAVGRRRRWHGRWFETRRVAEYLRHAPVLLLMGVSRTRSRWPRGTDARWPERYAREALREPGLPRARITKSYLRAAVSGLLGEYVRAQREYHRAKAARLARVHHGLDRLSELLFILAIVCVAAYLMISLAGAIGLASAEQVHALAKPFTFLGVFMPAIGGAFAGIRYFGDFERFSAISEVTAEKLDGLDARIGRMLAGSERGLCYSRAASLAHAMDDIVVAEIESWQSVFAGKNIAVPV